MLPLSPILGLSIYRDTGMEGLSWGDTEAPGSWVQQEGHKKPLAALLSPVQPLGG